MVAIFFFSYALPKSGKVLFHLSLETLVTLVYVCLVALIPQLSDRLKKSYLVNYPSSLNWEWEQFPLVAFYILSISGTLKSHYYGHFYIYHWYTHVYLSLAYIPRSRNLESCMRVFNFSTHCQSSKVFYQFRILAVCKSSSQHLVSPFVVILAIIIGI